MKEGTDKEYHKFLHMIKVKPPLRIKTITRPSLVKKTPLRDIVYSDPSVRRAIPVIYGILREPLTEETIRIIYNANPRM